MKIAVLTLCRDRLDYTKRCFASLRDNAGCDYDHFVLDQGSTDGTAAWLEREYALGITGGIVLNCENVGIHHGMNMLLNRVVDERENHYDLLVKVDNDCLLLTPGTLKAVAEHVLEAPEEPRVVSPLILGLRNRPAIYATKKHLPIKWVDDGDGLDMGIVGPPVRLGLTQALGGIFMPIPPSFVKAGFRYDETGPLWGGDDERICAMVQEQGGYTGYLLDYEAEHIDTTLGQVQRYPDYFARRVSEGGPAQ